MKNDNLKRSIIWFSLFIIFTVLVKTVDVEAIGPEGSVVGFAKLNSIVRDMVGTNDICYKISKYAGLFSILICGLFGIKGFIELVTKKSLFKVNYKIVALGLYYIITIAFYVIFTFVAVNYRPVLEDGALEASYPSSHTMLAICVIAGVVMYAKGFKKAKAPVLCWAVCILYIAMAVVTRVLSGVHWFTDIIAAIILSMAIIPLYPVLCSLVKSLWNKINQK